MARDGRPLTVLADPLLDGYGPSRPAILVAKGLAKKSPTTIISTTISEPVARELEGNGIQYIDLGTRGLTHPSSLTYLEHWLREVLLGLNSSKLDSEQGILLNFSNTMMTPASAWYLQGPVSTVLRNIKRGLALRYRLPLHFLLPLLEVLDLKTARTNACLTELVVANSRYCAELYYNMGIHVSHVIYGPLDCELFRPSTSSPSRDYVAAYFGKETDFLVIKRVADSGVPIRAFGAKMTHVPASLRSHPKVLVLGRISAEELADLYSNALFTLYPFTDEEFGYVPVESMACGTPVLSYDMQGPSETILRGTTGFLARDADQLVGLAVEAWRDRSVLLMAKECRRRSLHFDATRVCALWSDMLGLDAEAAHEEQRSVAIPPLREDRRPSA